MAKQTIGEFLATLRRANGFTQQDVADRLGISNRTLSAWECGNALPDILLLPVLAELYGVTTDEILSGQRKSGEAPVLSKKSEKQLLKSKLATFTLQAYVLLGVFLVGLILFFVGWYKDIVTTIWIGWQWWLLLLYLGLVTVIFSVVCLIALWKFAEAAVEETETNGAFYLLLRGQVAVCAYVAAALSLILALVALWLSFTVFEGVGWLMLVFFGLGLLFFLAGWVIKSTAVQDWGDECTKSELGKNKKLYRKVALFGLIPVGIAIALMFTFSVWWPESRSTEYEAETVEEFVREMESFDVRGIYFGWDGAPEGVDLPEMGTYYFPLSELAKTAMPFEEIELEDGFSCYFSEDKNECWIRSPYEITHGDLPGYSFRFGRVYTKDGSFSVYNVKYKYLPVAYTNMAEYTRYEVELRGEGAAYVWVVVENYSQVAYSWGIFLIATDAAVCVMVCAVKRKKIAVKL